MMVMRVGMGAGRLVLHALSLTLPLERGESKGFLWQVDAQAEHPDAHIFPGEKPALQRGTRTSSGI
jgi:hypothetical protein